MTTNDRSGPAFPVPPARMFMDPNGLWDITYADPGMTLRDYFAGQGIVAIFAQCAGGQGIARSDYDAAAGDAYALADAMLVAREAKREGGGE